MIERLSQLRVALLADCLDAVGLRNQCLPSHIRPLEHGSTLCGTVLPVQLAETPPPDPSAPHTYDGMISAIEALAPGDVIVASTCPVSLWGELLATAAIARGSRGIVCDAWVRDSEDLRELGFATFCAGLHPSDMYGRGDVVSSGQPIEIAGVRAERGDYVVADRDGIVIVPAAVAAEVVERAIAKDRGESTVRVELAAGEPIGDVFARHGIL